MTNENLTKLVYAYNQSNILLETLVAKGATSSLDTRQNLRDSAMIARYNVLWKEARSAITDPNFERLVPPFLSVEQIAERLLIPQLLLHLLIGLLLFIGVLGIVFFGDIDTVQYMSFGLLGAGLIASMLLMGLPFQATVREVYERTNTLQRYVQYHINQNYADVVTYSSPDKSSSGQHGKDLAKLQTDLYILESELETAQDERERWRRLWAALKTPSKYEIDQVVLDKLSPLEKTRLLEAVQAYRVNAWTPVAAVCGILFEGRLQHLCSQNGLRTGDIGSMIESLGKAGILKGRYEQLARVGEFFRYRSSHPTSEEFDKEKTTLLLTSLVILMRDLS